MKLEFIKDCAYAFDHINATEFSKDDIFETENKEFIKWALKETGFAKEFHEPKRKKPKPKENKAAGPKSRK